MSATQGSSSIPAVRNKLGLLPVPDELAEALVGSIPGLDVAESRSAYLSLPPLAVLCLQLHHWLVLDQPSVTLWLTSGAVQGPEFCLHGLFPLGRI